MSQTIERDKEKHPSVLRRLLHNEASGGLMLMAAAVLELIVANLPAADIYFRAL